MKIKSLLFSLAIVCFSLTSCNKEAKKGTTADANKQKVSLIISGMTCEIGCAKTIQSKLSKKEGVLDAKVVFTDSIANIEFDANITSKKDLIAFVDGIAGGDLYKSTETTAKKPCKEDCTKACWATKDAKKCDTKCSEKCDVKDCKKCEAKKMACKEKCATKKCEKKQCKEDCKKECCAKKATA